MDSGHVGTPWGDKGGLAKGVSPVRGLNAFADAAVVDDDDDGSTTNEAWVTVFGFPPGSLASVLEAFQRDGDVVTHDSFVRQGSGSGDRLFAGPTRDRTGCTCVSPPARARRGRFDGTGPR